MEFSVSAHPSIGGHLAFIASPIVRQDVQQSLCTSRSLNHILWRMVSREAFAWFVARATRIPPTTPRFSCMNFGHYLPMFGAFLAIRRMISVSFQQKRRLAQNIYLTNCNHLTTRKFNLRQPYEANLWHNVCVLHVRNRLHTPATHVEQTPSES